MIPLRSSERVYSTPKVTAALIAVNVAVWLYQAYLPGYAFDEFAQHWGIVPDNFRLITLVTSMFLHGGWLHIIGNMLFLWVFGRNVEDLVGGWRYFILYMAGGLAAGALQYMINYYSPVPIIGASGAIAGVMGRHCLMKFPAVKHLYAVPDLCLFHHLGDPGRSLPAVLVRDPILLRRRIADFGRLHRRRHRLVRARRRIHRRLAYDPSVSRSAPLAHLALGSVTPSVTEGTLVLPSG